MKRKLLPGALLLCGLLAAPQLHAAESIAASSDGRGGILVMWTAPKNALPPNGFRLRRTAGGQTVTLAEALRVTDDQEAMARLSAQEQAGLRQMRAQMKAQPQPLGLLMASAAADFDFARALGVGFRDAQPPAGAVTYSIEALHGTRAEPVGTSRAVSRDEAPVAPLPPANLTATVTRDGVTLTADAPSKTTRVEAAAVSYLLVRSDGKTWARVSPRPAMRTTGAALVFVDPKPPAVEAQLTYAVVSRSVFGVESPRSQPATVFIPDFAALDAPRNVTADANAGSIRVTWEKERNANMAGFVVQRAPNVGGPYTRLTPQPIAAREYVDTTARVGTTNYYQVVSINKRGEEGGPSLPSVAVARAAKPPAAPAELSAERKTGRIVVSWNAVEGAELQGYRVERDAGDGAWTILSATPSTDPRFGDRLPVGVLGVMKYRVFAIALDGQESAPSAVLTVTLPRAHAPVAPEITSISGLEGRVRIDWRPTGERGEATHFLVLRSNAANDEGVIVTPAPIAFPSVTFTDDTVTAGARYFYRVVSFDAAGNRSVASEAASVHVGTPPLPALAPPQLRYETKPYPRVVARWTIPNGFKGRVVLERRDGEAWRAISAPSAEGATQLFDTRPIAGARTAYRLVSVGANGAIGGASTAAEVDVP
ncbi:MAG TPA: hypothetical protein VE010_00250 [Thermoanaerobaculia bacterium]|nr:hypothetical protein [Thermoanaerobaculia bacterium]